ncbi:uncharacterized protein LOC108194116 [Daucus carota subsp. sativus]|uniref:uncharacterized protein LOC108194116 n=1 Tax=Daucus carota subsp. sativus TaxID=79200 RepID=UPI0007EF4D73|nr:PREDICTED: uncharacterized protein LOC108194116 [Daucus carota subsp. sativus]XP_017216504.1 PREDICTED: uncharacterized protein LOC108194116 [Daucus carota subsp. sativus]
MNKEEKKRKFHDSLLKMLYPPSPPREPHQSPHHSTSTHDFDDDVTNLSSSSSDGDGDVGGQQKLTRAQRKRLRKKKLRQAASQRRPIIGPLLPTTSSEADEGLVLDETQPVRQNAAEGSVVSGIHSAEEQGPSSNQNKLKQRRIAKKLTRDIKEQKDSSHRGL